MVKRLYILLFLMLAGTASAGASRIKDVTTLQGDRENQLVGYGLVVGLAGDGDSQQSTFTVQSIANMLQRFGVSVPADKLRSKNVAAVMITVDIPAFVKPGERLDVLVSSLGDADSIYGGTLLQTPLLGADEQVYAVAQGAVLVGGFSVGDQQASVQQNHPTVGIIPGGAIVEREIQTRVLDNQAFTLFLQNPDYVSAVSMAEKINTYFPAAARALSPNAIRVQVPAQYQGEEMTFIASVQSIEVEPDTVARVVVNERSGTIVATAEVRLSEVAINHGNITVSVARTPVVSQPNAFSNGKTVVTSSTDLNVTERAGGFRYLDKAPTLQDLTTALNSLGVSPRDMMSILQALKTAGALQAELIIE
ncbi:flagellar basal body P-ring protein FlgI [Ruficoccus amylovorans]|uniref:Flagellar P-ring protein n=1 Tax=Ruficoccus amylovorans TaxID=1804625 RepID=A0A842HHJ1_9BACT|nr:flagellar basal body P-ring protein FlgI [Ruficoccus amylovorans]MBC2595034.1 flagellar basal body P-ring protein FlgI [Ruficoccus amylovorans]